MLAAVLANALAKRLVSGLISIEQAATTIMANGSLEERVEVPLARDEVHRLAKTFNAMMDSPQAAVGRAMTADRLETIDKVASQVAHDIRSPLAAVKMALHDLAKMPEETRCLVRSAVFRIEDIANHLLLHRKGKVPDTNLGTHLASDLVETIVSEKRTEYRSRLSLTIESECSHRAYGTFIRVDPTGFERILSNLINNAVEATAGTVGRIMVHLDSADDNIMLRIRDNGKGMPEELCAQLGETTVSQGKENGNGIGVWSARPALDKWSGSLRYESELNVGTSAIIQIPMADAPAWFLSGLTVTEGQRGVVLDDE